MRLIQFRFPGIERVAYVLEDLTGIRCESRLDAAVMAATRRSDRTDGLWKVELVEHVITGA